MICPNCGSSYIHYGSSDDIRVCHKCCKTFFVEDTELENLISNALKRIYEIEKRLKEIDK